MSEQHRHSAMYGAKVSRNRALIFWGLALFWFVLLYTKRTKIIKLNDTNELHALFFHHARDSETIDSGRQRRAVDCAVDENKRCDIAFKNTKKIIINNSKLYIHNKLTNELAKGRHARRRRGRR